MKNNFTLQGIICVTFLFLGTFASQAQLVTTNADDGSLGSLRNQIAIALPGEIITFSPTVNNIVLVSGQITIDKSLTLMGNPLLNTTINGNAGGRIFDITAGNVILNDLILTNGLADNGGAIQIMNANLTIDNTTITNSIANGTSGSGGGIYVRTGATLTAFTSTISGNTANRAGGGIESVAGTTTTLTNVNLSMNNAGLAPATAAPGNGGALHITGNGTATITAGTVNMNTAASEGGGLWNGTGTMTINGTTINGNTASGVAADNGGGGIYNLNGGTLNITDATISNNMATGTAGSGGGILNDVGATLNITNSSITGNTANRAGGGIEGNATAGTNFVNLTNVNLNGNTVFSAPGNGGGLHMTGPGTIMITDGTVNTNTAGAEGGGLWNGSGTMTINGTTINGNTASGAGTDQGGGGIYNFNGGTLVITDAVISNNIANGTAGSGGGILNDVGAQLSVTDSQITGNSAIRAGGGIEDNSLTSTIILTNVNLNTNAVTGPPGNGGGLHITGAGSATITGGTVNNNTATLEGGGLWNGAGTMIVDGTTINANTCSGMAADDGGAGIFNTAGILIVTNATITNNLATGTSGSGGGIFSMAGTVTITDSTLDGNAANRAGGAIEVVAGILTITNSDLTNNDVDGGAGTPNPGNGGALHISGVTTTIISGGTASGNDARREGGALWNQTGSTMSVTNLTVDNNTASGPDAAHGGGGIFNNGGTLNLNNSTLSNNISDGALGNGGGLHVKTGTVNVMLTTFSGNTSANHGGGIYNNDMLFLNAVTIANNSAVSNGGGIANNSTASPSLKNTIVALNTAAMGSNLSNANGNYTSNGYNLIGQDEANVFPASANDLEGTVAMPINPLFGTLANNGGTTFTLALLQNSPAFNAGDPTDMFNDQIGSMVFGGIRDIGAFEAQSTLGINDLVFTNNKKSILYPNPSVNGMVTIQITSNFGNNVSGRLIEIGSGKVVQSFTLNNVSSLLNFSNLSSGIYVVELVSDIQTETHKLVLAR